MKKVLLVAVLLIASFFTCCYAQDVKVNVNSKEYSSQNDGGFTINGIPASEDIGGVDVDFTVKDIHYYANFKNYNSSTVTVLVVISYISGRSNTEITRNFVLSAYGTKEIDLGAYGCEGSIKGMIVRKVQ